MNKKYIIEEIIRTAKENNNIPLGRTRFEKETDIKYTDWYGKYWTKWGDAIKESGFRPNKLQSAYDKNWLMEQVILLIREINKFPTRGDMKIKSYKTKDFPNDNTISRRLGVRIKLAQKLLDYCKGEFQYQDIIDVCKNYCSSSKEKIKDTPQEINIKYGFVYLTKSGRFYKIGKADFVEKRNYEIGLKLPEESKVIHTIKTDDPFGVEAYWHQRFKIKRKKGEWFDLSSKDVQAFKRWKKIA